MHLQPKRLIQHQKPRLPQLSHFQAPPCQLIPLPNLGTRHPLSQKLMHRMSSAGSFLRKSAFQSRNYWLCLQRSGGISRKQPPRRGYQLCQRRHNPKQPIMLPLSQWTSTTNIFRLNQHCHFGQLRLLWITQLWSRASSTVAARSLLSARTYGKDWGCQRNMSKSCSWSQLMDNPMRPWEQSLASDSQSERSAFNVRFRSSRNPPLNASSV